MNTEQIPIIVVSYNSAELIEVFIRSIRQYYANMIYIIDGSDSDIASAIEQIASSYENTEFIPFGYNIHHGPGMAWAINNLNLVGPALFLDSDVEILNSGFLESLLSHLTPEMYGVGDITHPLLDDSPPDHRGIAYLSPACMLCNMGVMKSWPPPIKHGAPMILPMLALSRAGKMDLIRQVEWVKNDYAKGTNKIYFRHDWQGTVIRTGGYHYDNEPVAADYNYDLLPMIPTDAQCVMEIGCGNGALARAYKRVNPVCSYTGVDIDGAFVDLARKPCDFVFKLDIGHAENRFFQDAGRCDCWIFSDVLEYLESPASLLAEIRKVIPRHGRVIACVANMQHWSVQTRLNHGDLYLDESGLLDLGRLRRLFTRTTIFEMFQQAGFQIARAVARVSRNSGEHFFPAIRLMAQCAGRDPEMAVLDAVPLQYILEATPAGMP